MPVLISMAFRNVGRNKRRSFLAVLSVSLSILLIVFMQGLIEGYIDSLVRNYTRSESGHIRISTKGFAEKSKFLPVTENLRDADAVIAKVRSTPRIAKDIRIIAPRISFGVLLDNNGNNKTAQAIAGDTEIEKDLMLLHKGLLPGSRYLAAPRDMIMGVKLAEALGFTLGDTVKVMTQGSDFALNLRKFVLAGIFHSNVNALDENVFQIGLADAQALLRAGNSVQQIAVFIDDYRQADAYAERIQEQLQDPDLEVASWTTTGPYYQIVKLTDRIYGWIYFVIALLGAFIIFNIMMIVVLERRKEIGILKAIGFKRREILGLFFAEGVLLGCMGSLTGIAVGAALNGVLGVTGLDFTKAMATLTMPVDNVVYPRLGLGSMVGTFIMGVAVAALVSLIPSRQAARMNVVDAIKGA